MRESARWLGIAIALSACGSDAGGNLAELPGVGKGGEFEGMPLRFDEGVTPEDYESSTDEELTIHTNLEPEVSFEQPRDLDDGIVLRVTSLALFEPPRRELRVGVKNFGTVRLCGHSLQVALESANGKVLFAEQAPIEGRLYETRDGALVSCLEPGAESAVRLAHHSSEKFDEADIAHAGFGFIDDWNLRPSELEPFSSPQIRSLYHDELYGNSTSLTGQMKAGNRALKFLTVTFHVRDTAGYFRDEASMEVRDVRPNALISIDASANDTRPEDVADVLVTYSATPE